MSLFALLDKRRLTLQIGALLTFALIPLWDRFPRGEPPPLGLPDLNVSYYVLLLPMLWTIAAWLLAGLPGLAALWRDRVRRLWALALFGLAAWAVASLGWAFAGAFDADAGQTAALQWCIVVLFVLAVACAGPPPRAVVAVLAAALLANATITILQAQTQGSIGLKLLGEYEFGLDKPGVGVVQAAGVRWVRPLGLMPHPNMLAGTLLAGLLASAALVLSSRACVRWLGSGLFALGLWALLLTFSRAAWLGLALGVLLVLPLLRWALRDRARRIQVVVTLGLALGVGAAFVAGFTPFLAARAGTGQESIELRSVADRIVFTDFALRSIGERPVSGVGIGNFPWRTSYYLVETFYELRGDHVHNVYLLAWAELGMVGLGLLGVALLAGLAAVWRGVRVPSDSDRISAREPGERDRFQQCDESAVDSTVGMARHAPTRRLFRQRGGSALRDAAPGNHSEVIQTASGVDDRTARVALLAVVLAYAVIGLLDHYPWTILHFQVAWWGAIAVASRPVGSAVSAAAE